MDDTSKQVNKILSALTPKKSLDAQVYRYDNGNPADIEVEGISVDIRVNLSENGVLNKIEIDSEGYTHYRFFENGNIKSHSIHKWYLKDMINSFSSDYYEFLFNIVNAEKMHEFREWNDDGKLIKEGKIVNYNGEDEYINNGDWKEYFNDGSIKKISYYLNDLPVQPSTEYNEDRTIKMRVFNINVNYLKSILDQSYFNEIDQKGYSMLSIWVDFNDEGVLVDITVFGRGTNSRFYDLTELTDSLTLKNQLLPWLSMYTKILLSDLYEDEDEFDLQTEIVKTL